MALPALASLLLGLFAAALLASHPVMAGNPEATARGLRALVAAFAAGIAVALLARPLPAALALYAGGAAAVSLLAAPRPLWRPLLAGFGAGLTIAATFAPGGGWLLPALAWLAALAAIVACAHRTAADPGFAPQALRDQGECAIVIAAPVVAALPGAAAGWQSALAFAGPQAVSGVASPGLWLLVPLLALVGGILHQLWWRRR